MHLYPGPRVLRCPNCVWYAFTERFCVTPISLWSISQSNFLSFFSNMTLIYPVWDLKEAQVQWFAFMYVIYSYSLYRCCELNWASQVVQWKRIHLLIQEMQERLFDPWVRKIPGKRKWQPTPVFLPEKSHGQRNLVGYSPWGHKESDPTEAWAQSLKKLIFCLAWVEPWRTIYVLFLIELFPLLCHRVSIYIDFVFWSIIGFA